MGKKLDRMRIRSAVRNERTITVKTTNYLAEERASIDEVLEIFLEEASLLEYKNKISYCVHELASNAQKANTKRAYFHKQGLDIRDERDYERGMQTFRADVFSNVRDYLETQRRLGLHMKLSFLLHGPEARIAVSQNVGLTGAERRRIQEKLDLARATDDLIMAYADAYDNNEGAGLGLVMTMIMLRHIGLHDDVLEPSFRAEETSFALRLRRLSEEALRTA